MYDIQWNCLGGRGCRFVLLREDLESLNPDVPILCFILLVSLKQKIEGHMHDHYRSIVNCGDRHGIGEYAKP